MRAFVVIAAAGVLAVSVATATAADLEAGQKIFSSKCAGCHGKDGKGNEKMAKMLKTAIPDLSALGAKPDSELAKFISEGKKPMPSFAKMSKSDLDAVVHYVKAIGTGSVAGK